LLALGALEGIHRLPFVATKNGAPGDWVRAKLLSVRLRTALYGATGFVYGWRLAKPGAQGGHQFAS